MLSARTGKAVLRPGWERILALVRVILTLGFLVVLLIVFGLTPSRMAGAIKGADGLHLALAMVVLSVLMLLLSLKWYLIARGLGIGASFFPITRSYLGGTVLNNVLPTAIGGDAYRVYSLSRDGNTSFKRSLASVVIERATGYAGLLVLSAAAASFYFLGPLPGIAVSLLLVVVLGLAHPLLSRLRDRNHGGTHDESWLSRRWPSAASNLYAVAGLSIVQQILWVTVAALLGLAYNASIPWPYWVLTVTAVTLLTTLPVSVGGLGLREVGYAALLAPVGVDASKAAAIGLAMGFGPFFVSLVGLLPFVVIGLYPQRSRSLPIGEIEDSEPEGIV
jgi:uncharacterized membrane protein YbhN (UPF0104 family)